MVLQANTTSPPHPLPGGCGTGAFEQQLYLSLLVSEEPTSRRPLTTLTSCLFTEETESGKKTNCLLIQLKEYRISNHGIFCHQAGKKKKDKCSALAKRVPGYSNTKEPLQTVKAFWKAM